MIDDPKKKPSSSIETLFELMDSLQHHKRKLANKPEPTQPGQMLKEETAVASDTEKSDQEFSFPIKTVAGIVIALGVITFLTLKIKRTDNAEIKNPVIVEASPPPQVARTQPSHGASVAHTVVPAQVTTSAFPRRIMQQPIPVPAHMQIPPDPEEQREREDREREYDRLQNPDIPPPNKEVPQDQNNISN
ncbi:MAG: hypothetical protein KA715_12100 [Xanthomonadaceae bacterium]|nr:hypothetical protein [Xanthomonadaceae bacterium]